MNLRPYQIEAINEVHAHMRQGIKSTLICMPTGAGKTLLTAHMLKSAASKGKHSLFIVHRRELIKQSIEAFKREEIWHGVIASGFGSWRMPPVQISSIQTLKNRLDKINKPHLVVWDEAHHCTSKSYKAIRKAFPDAYHIGLSATPQRLDRAGLIECFQSMVNGPSVQWLIDNGFLSPYKIYAPANVNLTGVHTRMGDFDNAELSDALDKPTITGDAINEYKKLANGKRAIVRGVSIKHSQHIAEQFNKAGIPSTHLDGTTPATIRDAAMEAFKRGEIKVLSNVDLFGEGLDIPAVECIIDLRPTLSLALWLQFCGRALRPHQGKKHAIIIDHASNSARHGLPCDIREWKLEGRPKRKKGEPEPTINIRTCSKCYFVCSASCTACPDCGHVFEIQSREVEHKDGELIEMDVEAMRRERLRAQGMAKSLEDLIEVGKKAGYKPGWAHAVHKARMDKKRKDAW